MPTILDKLRELVVEQLGVEFEQVTAESRFIEDLGADSLDCVEMVMAVEEEFMFDVGDEDMDTLTTVGKTADYIERKLKERHGG